ncbi:hypothetical protein Tchar_00152 [Tepidimonas charontis]|uniref:DUF2782 domain-containing protein n=1 Tax=Tepidimonas charontis TaxID=2267262 RepID=A0A554XL15_9BURK|nr:hypothetical protein Tchar_00152 [Tepidimonas charontis]
MPRISRHLRGRPLPSVHTSIVTAADRPARPGCRVAAAAITGLCAATLACAQPAPSAEASAARFPEPKVERLIHADGHSRVEEWRIGGQTRSIEVQTRSALPGYDVRPIDGARPDELSGAGTRRWRVLRF